MSFEALFRSFLVEAIKQSPMKGVKDKFMWNEFIRICTNDSDSLQDRIETANWYARVHLKKLGRGAARAVYVLNSRSALKIALDEPGLSQNDNEIMLSTHKNLPIANVLRSDSRDSLWIVSELVRAVTRDEFMNLSGIDIDDMVEQINELLSMKNPKRSDVNEDLTWETFNAVKKGNLALIDVAAVNHWGMTGDGRLVIMDYGYTQDMFDSSSLGKRR